MHDFHSSFLSSEAYIVGSSPVYIMATEDSRNLLVPVEDVEARALTLSDRWTTLALPDSSYVCLFVVPSAVVYIRIAKEHCNGVSITSTDRVGYAPCDAPCRE